MNDERATAIFRASLERHGYGPATRNRAYEWTLNPYPGEASYMGDPLSERTQPGEREAITETREQIENERAGQAMLDRMADYWRAKVRAPIL